MKQLKRLGPVIKMARDSEQVATRELASARSCVAKAEQKIAELRAYREEYLEGMHYKTQTGLNAMQMKDYRVFLGRLDAAIRQQAEILRGLISDAGKAEQTWLAEKQRLAALDKLADRHMRREQQDSNCREQAESNEHALRNWRRAPS